MISATLKTTQDVSEGKKVGKEVCAKKRCLLQFSRFILPVIQGCKLHTCFA